MIKAIDQLIQNYDAATVFVVAATVVVILELSLMRILVPSESADGNTDSNVLMEQVYNETSVAKITEKLDSWSSKSSMYVNRLTTQPTIWQKELQTTVAFGFEQIPHPTIESKDDEETKQKAAADYAAGQLYLQSIMTGSAPLANINGNIYRIGDEIPVRGGEIIMIIVELRSDYAIIHLDGKPDIRRTIYLSRDMQLANGERLP